MCQVWYIPGKVNCKKLKVINNKKINNADYL